MIANKENEYYTPKPQDLVVGMEVETNNVSTRPLVEQTWHKLIISEYTIEAIKSDLMGHCPPNEVAARTKSIRIKKG